MQKDLLLGMFFEKERWEKAINTAVLKDIDKTELRKLCSPQVRANMYEAIKNNKYIIAPPHQALIPKDDGTFRTVYINEDVDRIFLSIANDLIFELCSDMVHKQCKSYQSGISCGKVVQEVSERIVNTQGTEIGIKADLSKYFDSVPIQFIDKILNKVEENVGQSAIIDVIRKYYHTDYCFDTEGKLIQHYQSLKQGCAFASFLADAVLYDIDEAISKLDVYYVRYSDDILIVGKDWCQGHLLLETMLNEKGLVLNPKKVEVLTKDKFFKFLGFSIRGPEISLSKGRLKTFYKEIMEIAKKAKTMKTATTMINRFLYIGDGQYSWATSVLPIMNVAEDIKTLNNFVMDAIRSAHTKRFKIGGLGYETNKKVGVITRGTGKNVRSNRERTPAQLENYKTLGTMQNALLKSKALYDTLVKEISL